MWKSAERWFANWLGGNRVPSQGKAHQDIEGEWFVAEHKYRNFKDYPAEFRHAIEQMDTNTANHPDKISLLALSLHKGRGLPTRRLLVFDVAKYPSIKDFLEELNGTIIQKQNES